MDDCEQHLLQRLEKALNYNFNDNALLKQALTHRSFNKVNNERFEFLGDSVLGCVIAAALYDKFPKLREGDLTKMRARLVRGTTLADVAKELNIGEYLYLGEGERKSGGHNRESILSDAFEAIVGAIYLDQGFHSARRFILEKFHTRLDQISPKDTKDNKTRLQEYLQKMDASLPIYEVTGQNGNQHSLVFTVSCEVDHPGSPFHAEGTSRRIAEQNAAAKALNALQNNQ